MRYTRRLIPLLVLVFCTMAASAADDASRQQIERGQYLARAADCAACHTAEGGTPYAGGYAVDTPFGEVFGTNITPDEKYGIGDYSADDFYHVLTEGELPDGTQLYPAMPYTSYHDIPREDSDAMYAYFMSIDGVHQPAPETDLPWPFSMRWTLNFWNLLFAEAEKPEQGDADAQQQRGRYLVETLGHCGECHTPRNLLGAVDGDQHLQGAVIAGYEAPSLKADAMAARGWDPASLRTFLREGMSDQGSMFSEMYPVFHHSTRYLDDADLKAMSGYLMGRNPPEPKSVEPVPIDNDDPGRQVYLDSCAGCHGAEGEGVPHVAAAMVSNTTLRLQSPRNLIRVIHDGINARQFSGFERMQAMPGFADKLDDDDIANLVNYLRRRWGGVDADIDSAAVSDYVGGH